MKTFSEINTLRQEAIEIAEQNARSALDQVGDYDSREDAVAAYLVNVFDTFAEKRIIYGREAAVKAFFAIVHETTTTTTTTTVTTTHTARG